MPARVALRFAVAALLLSVGCTRAGPAPLSEADKVALRAIDQRFADAVLAKNWAGAAAVYSTEASLMQPNGPAVNGRAMIQAWRRSHQSPRSRSRLRKSTAWETSPMYAGRT